MWRTFKGTENLLKRASALTMMRKIGRRYQLTIKEVKTVICVGRPTDFKAVLPIHYVSIRGQRVVAGIKELLSLLVLELQSNIRTPVVDS
jgi:hypothetical protein